MSEPTAARHTVWMSNLSVLVILSTVASVLLGWLWPGPIAGLGMPISLTAWWLLYRVILWRERRGAPGEAGRG